MSILQSGGALEQFAGIQQELSRAESQAEALRERHRTAERLESEKTGLDIERNQLLLRLREDYDEQDGVVRKAIVSFQEVSADLYEEAGSLTLNPTRNGPELQVSIHGSQSHGISNMQVFCFDMMLMRMISDRHGGPGFLVHDSHLFDGVDSRQVATAFAVGAREAEARGFQYVVTMNSDVLPDEFRDAFELGEHVLPVRLTDATVDGGLFGMRFG